jgi:hypothetical protein
VAQIKPSAALNHGNESTETLSFFSHFVIMETLFTLLLIQATITTEPALIQMKKMKSCLYRKSPGFMRQR